MTTYYVHNTAGSDLAAGTSTDTPWKTITKVNASTFQPGDVILFARGQTWEEQRLVVPSSGREGAPIAFGAYGSGPKPEIDGGGNADCIECNSRDYIVFASLNALNGLDFAYHIVASDYVSLIECDGSVCGNDVAIFSDACTHGRIMGGVFHTTTNRLGTYISACIEITNGGDDFLIDGAECYGGLSAGITVHNHDFGGGEVTEIPTGVRIINCNIHDNTGSGCILKRQGVTGAAGIVYENCTITGNTLDGIQAYSSDSGFPDVVTVRGCAVLANARTGLSLSADNVLVEQCLVTSNNAVAQVCITLDRCIGATVRNCTLYQTGTSSSGILQVSGTRTNGVTLRNNILKATNANNLNKMIQVTTGAGTGFSADYNLYKHPTNLTGLNRFTWNGVNVSYGNWLAQSGGDTHSLQFQDPLFAVEGSDFSLQAGSPARNIGGDVGLPYLGAAPDLGAYEYGYIVAQPGTATATDSPAHSATATDALAASAIGG